MGLLINPRITLIPLDPRILPSNSGHYPRMALPRHVGGAVRNIRLQRAFPLPSLDSFSWLISNNGKWERTKSIESGSFPRHFVSDSLSSSSFPIPNVIHIGKY